MSMILMMMTMMMMIVMIMMMMIVMIMMMMIMMMIMMMTVMMMVMMMVMVMVMMLMMMMMMMTILGLERKNYGWNCGAIMVEKLVHIGLVRAIGLSDFNSKQVVTFLKMINRFLLVWS